MPTHPIVPVTAANPEAWAASATSIEVAATDGGYSTLDADMPHSGEIDDQFSLQGTPRPVMPTAPDRQRQAARAGGSDGGSNVAGALAKDDHRRAAGDGGIPDMSCLVIGWAGREHFGGIQFAVSIWTACAPRAFCSCVIDHFLRGEVDVAVAVMLLREL